MAVQEAIEGALDLERDFAALAGFPKCRHLFAPFTSLQPRGLDAGNGADLVIVGGVAGNTDGAKQRRAVLDLHAAGHTGTGWPCASAFTAL